MARPFVRHNPQISPPPLSFPHTPRSVPVLITLSPHRPPFHSPPPPSSSILFPPLPPRLRDSSTIPRPSSPRGGTARNEYYDRISHRTACAQPAESGPQCSGFDRNVRNHGAQWACGSSAQFQKVSDSPSPEIYICAVGGDQCDCGHGHGRWQP